MQEPIQLKSNDIHFAENASGATMGPHQRKLRSEMLRRGGRVVEGTSDSCPDHPDHHRNEAFIFHYDPHVVVFPASSRGERSSIRVLRPPAGGAGYGEKIAPSLFLIDAKEIRPVPVIKMLQSNVNALLMSRHLEATTANTEKSLACSIASTQISPR